jgi:hypothetical protein
MRQAIETRYMGPTNYLGSRIKAKADAGSMVYDWDYGLNTQENHLKAAKALQEEFNWSGELSGGSLPSPHTGYCFVMVGD